MHYQRWWKHGTVEDPRPKTIPYCTVPGCDRSPRTPTSGLCEMHYYRKRRHGSVHAKLKNRPPVGPENPNWTEEPNYNGIHARLRRVRGHPSHCVKCGARSDERRLNWAFDWRSPRTLHVDELGRTYSTDIRDYIGLCQPCHYHFDEEYRAKTMRESVRGA